MSNNPATPENKPSRFFHTTRGGGHASPDVVDLVSEIMDVVKGDDIVRAGHILSGREHASRNRREHRAERGCCAAVTAPPDQPKRAHREQWQGGRLDQVSRCAEYARGHASPRARSRYLDS